MSVLNWLGVAILVGVVLSQFPLSVWTIGWRGALVVWAGAIGFTGAILVGLWLLTHR